MRRLALTLLLINLLFLLWQLEQFPWLTWLPWQPTDFKLTSPPSLNSQLPPLKIAQPSENQTSAPQLVTLEKPKSPPPPSPLKTLIPQEPPAKPINPIPKMAVPSQTELSCFQIGPFAKDSELAVAKTQLRTKSLQIEKEQTTEEQQLTGIWVYIPPTGSSEAARQKAKQLSADGIKEFGIVTSGEFDHAISLGLYSKPVNAELRVTELKSKGHPEVTVQERHKTTTHHWIIVSLPPGKEDLLSAFAQKKSIDCP